MIDLCLATEPTDRPTAKQAFDIISSCSPHLAAPSPAATPQLSQEPIQPQLASVDQSTSSQPAAAARFHGEEQAAADTRGAAVDWTRQQLQVQQAQAQVQSVEMPTWQSQAASIQPGLSCAQMPGHQLSLLENDAESHAFDSKGVPQTASLSTQAVWSGTDKGSALPHQMLAVSQDGQDTSRRKWWSSSQGQAHLSPVSQSVPVDQTAGMLPLGVQGHLYPSPFAMAADDASGPLWSWHNGP